MRKISKILLVVICILFIFVSFASYSFATVQEYDSLAINYISSNLPNSIYFIYKTSESSKNYSFYYYDGEDYQECYFKLEGTTLRCYSSLGTIKTYKTYSDGHVSGYNVESNTFNTTSIMSANNFYFSSSYLNYVIYTNINIYNGDELVFQPTASTVLAMELEKVQPVAIYQTMMSGIIKCLIVFLIGLVAFWKGYSLLSNCLRKA